MKHDWEYKKIGEVCEVSAGQGAPQGEQSYCENGTPFIKAGNLEDLVNGLDEGNVQKVSQSIAQKHKLKLYKAGSVLFAKSGMSCMKGYVHVLQRDCYVVSHLSILTPKTIEGHFLKYYLRFTKTYSLVKDEAYPSISLSDIASFPVPVPALAVQERIVGELDKVSEIIEKKKQQVKELDSLAQSIFYDMFGDPVENEKGWEKQMIGELCEDKKSIIRANKTFCQTDIIRYIDISSIDNKANVVVSMTQFVYKDAPSRAQQVVNYGDILVSLVRPNLKNIATVNDLGEDLVASSGFCVLRTKMCAQLFLKGVLLSDRFTKYLTDRVSGANYPAIREEDIKCCLISVPPLSLQQAFAEKVEAIEKQKELITASLKEAETLFDARMEYWFGE